MTGRRRASASRGRQPCRARGGRLPIPGLLAPIRWPSAIYCAGANYADHAAEMARAQNRPPPPDPHTLGLKPWHFIKAGRSTLAAPDETVAITGMSQTMDWEIELAAVIGARAKNVSLAQALDHVAGYTIANDLSARDMGRRTGVPDDSPFKFDWVAHKNFDGSCPLGPWIVPAGDIPDPQNLGLKLWVNDVIKQDSNTAKMIFSIAEQIAHLSSRITLNPGDVVLTGTPSGVGAARKEFLEGRRCGEAVGRAHRHAHQPDGVSAIHSGAWCGLPLPACGERSDRASDPGEGASPRV